MQVMDVLYVFPTFCIYVLSQLLNIDVFRSSFHHHCDNIFDNGHRGNQYDNGEEVRAKRVSVPQVGEKVDDSCGYYDTNAH